MSYTVRLHDIAHARAGDKGNISSVTVWVYDPRFYEDVRRALTAERLKDELAALLQGDITRYDLPELHALHFVMRDALEGGVNSSLNLDSHGKSWSYLLLGLDIEVSEDPTGLQSRPTRSDDGPAVEALP